MHYWQLVDETVAYGEENCLVLSKTKKLILNFRRKVPPLQPLQMNGTVVEHSDTFGILGLNINNAPSCSEDTMTTIRRAQQRLCYVRSLTRVGLSCRSLIQAYRGLLENTLTRGITVWFGNTTLKEREAFQRIIQTAEWLTITQLLSVDILYTHRCRNKLRAILTDPHPEPRHLLFRWRSSRHQLRCHQPMSIKQKALPKHLLPSSSQTISSRYSPSHPHAHTYTHTQAHTYTCIHTYSTFLMTFYTIYIYM